MTATCPPTVDVHLDADWAVRALLADVRRGFGRRPFSIPPRWLYDERGSELFDRITRLPEYYPTETERSILDRASASIAAISAADTIIELGSGTSDKTHTLLRAFGETGQLSRFVAFDVSEQTLRRATDQLAREYPGVRVHGIVGDFGLHLDELPGDGCPLVAFLGSTIGNLYPAERRTFLRSLAEHVPSGAWLLLGVDLVKPVERLIAAYDDAEGVTAEFTRNALHVLNREVRADFDVDAFEHVAFWDPRHERMDLRLRADGGQRVRLSDAELTVDIADGEEIRVEISTKFRLPAVAAELVEAGFEPCETWTDADADMALILVRRP